jgi:hypothetical protein
MIPGHGTKPADKSKCKQVGLHQGVSMQQRRQSTKWKCNIKMGEFASTLPLKLSRSSDKGLI